MAHKKEEEKMKFKFDKDRIGDFVYLSGLALGVHLLFTEFQWWAIFFITLSFISYTLEAKEK